MEGKKKLQNCASACQGTPAFSAVKDSLDREGKLGKFKAELRAAVMSILNRSPSDKPLPQVPAETRLLNDLIREYLIWNGYLYADQILLAESGQNSEKPSREYLATKLGVADDAKTAKIPLLYYIVFAFMQQQEKEQ